MGPYIIFSLGCENNVLSEIHEIQGKSSGLQAPHYEPKLEIWFTYTLNELTFILLFQFSWHIFDA